MREVIRPLRFVALAVLAVVTYHRALSAYFFDDDLQWLVGAWSFAPSNLWALGRMEHFYRPVIELYFAVATPVFGGSPVLFHAASIGMHVANGLVLFACLHRLTRDVWYAWLASLFFVVQPGGIDAVAWVGALGEPLGVLFGCSSLLSYLRWRESGRRLDRWLSWAAFAAALLTHESSVVFLPLLLLIDWVRHVHVTAWDRVKAVAPYAVTTAAYLVIDLYINSRNYLVREGHYAAGSHMASNALRYIESMYVGRFDLLNDVLVVSVLAALLMAGTRRTRLAVLWMLLALMPFLPFTWANTSRYMYQPAIGLSMLLADGVLVLDRVLRARTSVGVRALVVTTVAGLLVARSLLFAMHNVEQFTARTDIYRRQAARIVETHGTLSSHSVVPADTELKATLAYPFANALVSWVYRDPTITLEPY